ncbi:AlpA family phage regulatory protein [Sphingomonas sp. MA1305]|uniref:helix-turn-helix transcriptional regulator n=1 Tax=Sphingomonas sp. MA1305 TaxID=2479204 RepID=UPI0018DF75E3|nr:AlpA family phage regulatory protein [Sphingomonas sp. MA1305]MBI0476111.1 AlpA family phage regulatory protein [Sphingomonas sp. MA1305]
MSEPITILTVAQVCERLTISEPTLRRYSRRPDFPRKVQLGPRRVGFIKSDVEAFIERQAVSLAS